MEQVEFQYILNNIGHLSYVDAHSERLAINKKLGTDALFCICDWTDVLIKEENDFVWHNYQAKDASLLYYNYIAEIENNEYLKSRICATLIDLNQLHLYSEVTLYKRHMRTFANRIAVSIDTCIKQVALQHSSIWLFPISTSFVKSAVIIQRIKNKYPDAHVVIYGADAEKNNDFLVENKYIDAVICGSLYSEEALIRYLQTNSPKPDFWNGIWYWDETLQQLVKGPTKAFAKGVLFEKLTPGFKPGIQQSVTKKYYCNVMNTDETLEQIKALANIHNTAVLNLSSRQDVSSFESLLKGLLCIREQYPNIVIESVFYDGKLTNNLINLLGRIEVKKLVVDYYIMKENYEEANHTFAEILLKAKLLSQNNVELCLYRNCKSERLWDGTDLLTIKNCLYILRLFLVTEYVDWNFEYPVGIEEEINLWINSTLYKTNGRTETLKQYNSLQESNNLRFIITPINDGHLLYQEYMNDNCVRSLQLGKIDILLLQMLKLQILSFDAIVEALNEQLNTIFLSTRVIAILKDLESLRLIYINKDFSQVTSCIYQCNK